MSTTLDLATVEIAFFEPLLHEHFSTRPFEVSPGEPPFALELVRTTPHPLAGREGCRLPFSLFFDAPAGAHLLQGLYLLTHARTGEMLLFLVPVARRDDRLQLQAVLN